MSSLPASSHPRWLRLTHWLNALAVLVMVASGWRIYNASPLYEFSFPASITLGGWLGGALQWHFAAMWLLAFNGLVYLILNLFSGRLKRRARPNRQLIGFARVPLEAGASASVRFTVHPSACAYYDEEMRFVVEPGDLRVMIGGLEQKVGVGGQERECADRVPTGVEITP